MTKFNFSIEIEKIETNIRRLTNQLWKLIPMRENGENWERQLDSVILEITGFNEIFVQINLVSLLSKLEGLRLCDTSFETYRKTVFESISLLQEWKNYE